MKKTWLLTVKTWRQYLRSGTFLMLTLGLPVAMLLIAIIPFFSLVKQVDSRIGYVDLTGQLPLLSTVNLENIDITITTYADVESARSALEQDQIGGYLVIPAGYFEGQATRYYSPKSPGLMIQDTLARSIRRTLLADQPLWVTERFSSPAELTYAARTTGEVMGEGEVLLQFIAPFGLAMVFGLLILTGVGQMGGAIAEEKDHRAMEMVITSLTARQLVLGKGLGITLLAVTQLLVWTTGAGLIITLLVLAGGNIPLNFPWRTITWAVLLGGPGYFLYIVLAAGVGIIAGSRDHADQLSGLLGLAVMSPFYLLIFLINDLDGPIMLGLTWFPLTAPVMALIRMTLTEVPTWQLVVSLVSLIVSVAGSVWFVARIFRGAMLVYGQALRPRQIWQALRQG